MKQLIFSLILCPLLLLANFSHATPLGINIFTENNHIWGSAGRTSYSGGIYNSYDLTSNQPLHYRVEGSSASFGTTAVAESWAGDFKVESFSALWSGEATAQSTYTFQPEFDTLIVDVTAYDYSTHQCPTIWYSLTNTSSGEQLLYNLYDSLNDFDYHPSFTVQVAKEHFEINVNNKNIYELQLYVQGSGGDDIENTYLQWNMTSSPAPIPEPCTVLLFSAGLAGLAAGLKRKKE